MPPTRRRGGGFRYLIYYVWSELPPAEKPADIVLRSLKDTPVGTPVEEIKRASDAFGLDFNFMKAVAKIESGFDPKQHTGSYIGLFQLSKYEFNKFGSGQILDSANNAIAAAYKVITEGILFEWVTQKKPTLSDLYLIHQQGWEGAAEPHQPNLIASLGNPCVPPAKAGRKAKMVQTRDLAEYPSGHQRRWKTVDKLTSGAFVGMWRERVAHFYSEYMPPPPPPNGRTSKFPLSGWQELPHPRGPSRGLTAAAARGAAHRSVVARMHFTSSTTRSDRSYCALTR